MSTQSQASKSTQTPASKSTQTPASNVYSIYTQNVQKYFENISKITPQYFQAITQLQEECMKTCEKTINAAVSVQQEFATKSGLSTEIPNDAKNCNRRYQQANCSSNHIRQSIDKNYN